MNLIVISGIVIAVICIIIVLRNSVINTKNQVENAYAGIDVQLTKRYDLIPNLIETVKQYMEHEKELLSSLTELRIQATKPNLSSQEKVELDNKISKDMGKMMISVENYPDLKASENFVNLQQSLSEIEEQLSASRRFYNSAVTDYNNSIDMFPSSIFATQLGYKRRDLFIAPDHKKAELHVGTMF